MKRVVAAIHRLREEHGITGLETAIVLIAFVVVAAVFAFVVLSTGLFSSERGKETVYAGLAKTRGSMEVTGAILGTSNGTKLTALTFDVTLAAGGDSVNLDPSASTNRTVISYSDDSIKNSSLTYTVDPITGDSDNLLEGGELIEINLDISGVSGLTLGTNKTFTLEVKPPQGSFLIIQRTTPSSINQTIVNLN